MKTVCLDLEGVLVPEIWIAFAKATGIPELERTTRDEPDYNKLMQERMDILRQNNLTLKDIRNVIETIKPLEGAIQFTERIRSKTQLIILSDTFEEFAMPLMKQLNRPTIMCNNLITDEKGFLTGIKMRCKDSKKTTVLALKNAGMEIFASGDSFNDIDMIHTADAGCLFRAPENIKQLYPSLKICNTYEELEKEIDSFLGGRK